MNRFRVVLMKLKRWLRQRRRKQVQVQTYMAKLEKQQGRAALPLAFDDYLNDAKANASLKLFASDVYRISDRKLLLHSMKSEPDGIKIFHQGITESCMDFAEHVVVLQNKIITKTNRR